MLFYQLMELCKSAKKQVILHTPYVIANDWMTEQLSQIGSKGQILLNSAATNGNPIRLQRLRPAQAGAGGHRA